MMKVNVMTLCKIYLNVPLLVRTHCAAGKRGGENGFTLLHSSVIDNTLYKKVEGSGELIISLGTHTIGRQSGNSAGLGNEWLLSRGQWHSTEISELEAPERGADQLDLSLYADCWVCYMQLQTWWGVTFNCQINATHSATNRRKWIYCSPLKHSTENTLLLVITMDGASLSQTNRGYSKAVEINAYVSEVTVRSKISRNFWKG